MFSVSLFVERIVQAILGLLNIQENKAKAISAELLKLNLKKKMEEMG